jgi:hypothetical protein
VADHLNRKRIIIATQLVLLCTSVLLALLSTGTWIPESGPILVSATQTLGKLAHSFGESGSRRSIQWCR